jgi:hypothetical protein
LRLQLLQLRLLHIALGQDSERVSTGSRSLSHGVSREQATTARQRSTTDGAEYISNVRHGLLSEAWSKHASRERPSQVRNQIRGDLWKLRDETRGAAPLLRLHPHDLPQQIPKLPRHALGCCLPEET